MSDQIQCPNCGGYKVETLKKEYKKESRSITRTDRLRQAIGLMGIFWVCSLIGGVITAAMGETERLPSIVGAAVCLVPLMGLLVFSAKSRSIVVATIYHFGCSLCGYRWSWEKGTPIPQANVKPDLIATGARKLEEEERRRQEEAALHYLSKQGKK